MSLSSSSGVYPSSSLVSSPTPLSSVSLSGQKIISEKKRALVYFLVVFVISFVMYSIIQGLAKDECQNTDSDCYKLWSVPFGSIWLTVFITFIITIVIWLLTYYVFTNIQLVS